MRWLVSAMLMLAVVPLLPRARAAEDSWDSLKQLRSGEKIEVIDMRLKNLRGAFMSVSEEAISLQVGKDEVAVPRPNVFRVAVLDPSKRS